MLVERDEYLTFGDLAYEHIPRDHPLGLINQVLAFSFVPEVLAEASRATGRPWYDRRCSYTLFLAFLSEWLDRLGGDNLRPKLREK